MRLFLKFSFLLILTLLAGCPQLPQPFQHEYDNPLLTLDGRAGVVLAFGDDIPKPFAEAVRKSLNKRDVPAFQGKAPADALPLKLRARTSLPRNGTVLLELFWELRDADDLVINNYDQSQRVVEKDWLNGAPGLIKSLAEEAAPHLSGLMPIEEGTQPQSATVASAQRPCLFLDKVEGAPGDGNQSLSAAMRLALSANGIDMAESGGGKCYRLSGLVRVEKAGKDAQTLHLAWQLFDPKDAEMANLEQEGMVPMGLLDKPWGSLSGEIVAGTAQELAKLLKGQ